MLEALLGRYPCLKRPPSAEELQEISENWRPYRTWVALLLRTMLEDETHEIAGKKPGNASSGGHRTGAWHGRREPRSPG